MPCPGGTASDVKSSQKRRTQNSRKTDEQPVAPLTSGTWISRSPAQTVELGTKTGRSLAKGDVVALYGELGSGKTTFVKGLAAGLGAEREEGVRSPTFVLLNLYKGRLPVYHIDLYRVHSLERLRDMGYEDYAFGEGVTVIEWAERAEEALPERTVRVWFKSIGKRSREIQIQVSAGKGGIER